MISISIVGSILVVVVVACYMLPFFLQEKCRTRAISLNSLFFRVWLSYFYFVANRGRLFAVPFETIELDVITKYSAFGQDATKGEQDGAAKPAADGEW